MATLNIKNLPDDLHQELKERARREHRSVAQQVIHILSESLETPSATSILDLHGLGKTLWTGTDATTHVEQERKSWE